MKFPSNLYCNRKPFSEMGPRTYAYVGPTRSLRSKVLRRILNNCALSQTIMRNLKQLRETYRPIRMPIKFTRKQTDHHAWVEVTRNLKTYRTIAHVMWNVRFTIAHNHWRLHAKFMITHKLNLCHDLSVSLRVNLISIRTGWYDYAQSF